MRDLLAFLKGPWGVGGGKYGAGAVVSRVPLRSMPARDWRTAEEEELSELAYYGGYLVAESVPLELRAAIAVAPLALEVCLRIADEYPQDWSCGLCNGESLAGPHVENCYVGQAYHVARRFLAELEKSLIDAGAINLAPKLAALKDRFEKTLALPAGPEVDF